MPRWNIYVSVGDLRLKQQIEEECRRLSAAARSEADRLGVDRPAEISPSQWILEACRQRLAAERDAS